jgi:hypothetical protein
MREIFRSLLVLGVFLAAAMVCSAASLDANQIKVASQGVTDVTAAFGKTQVVVKITTHEVDIGKPSDEWPKKILSSCTYSRFPCSLVDYVEISVSGNALFVARSVYADLADVGTASLRQKRKKGQFVLTLCGGDASESYTVEVTFDENLVRERTLTSNEARQVMQNTTYFTSQSMNE